MSNTDSGDAPSGQPGSAKVVLKAYQRMLLYLFLGACTVVAGLSLLIFVPYLILLKKGGIESIPIFLVVVLAGTMGAFFSALQRLYDFKELPQLLYNPDFQDEHLSLFVYSLVPALIGGVAAAVIYLIFAGGLLSGAFFPVIQCEKGATCSNFGALLTNYSPLEAQDYAKVILWGFIAGFAERMVPNLLNTFAQSASKDAALSQRARDNIGADRKDRSGAHVLAIKEPLVAGELPPPAIASRGIANQS